MPKFDIDVVRTATCMKTITVNADNRLQAQDKALDQAGNHLYKELCATYALDDNRGRNVDEFSDLRASQLVLACSCSIEDITHPSYLVVQVTPELVRAVKNAMAMCQQHGLLKVVLAVPSTTSWAPSNDDGSTANAMGFEKMAVTKDDFCIFADMHYSNAVVESLDVPFNDLMQHISDKVPETVFFDGGDFEEQSLREQLADDRADQADALAAEAGEPNADLPQG